MGSTYLFTIILQVSHQYLSFSSIAEKVIKVTLADGGDDSKRALRRQLKRESVKIQNGAAFRWAVAASANGQCELQLHSLPLPAAVVSAKPLLLQDNIAVNLVMSWDIKTSVFNGIDGLSGPVPVLFNEQPEELRTTLTTNQDIFFSQLNAFMTK
jgi:hypothetical protein